MHGPGLGGGDGGVVSAKVPPVMCATVQVEGEGPGGVAREWRRHHAA